MSNRALIIEDDRPIRRLIATLLQREGFEVDEAANGIEGIERIDSNEYSIIVLDLMMPQVDGFAVLNYAAETQAETLKNVIVLTAMAPARIESRFPAGICRVLTKPFDVEHFLASVRHCAKAA